MAAEPTDREVAETVHEMTLAATEFCQLVEELERMPARLATCLVTMKTAWEKWRRLQEQRRKSHDDDDD